MQRNDNMQRNEINALNEINAFNNLCNEEKDKYIGVGFNTITNIHTRKKMCSYYKNIINPCQSKKIYKDKYYSNSAKMIAWKEFAINRDKTNFEALLIARQKAICIECVKHYYNIDEFFNIDLRNKLCTICKKYKCLNLCCKKCENLILNNSKTEVLELLLNPLKYMFPDFKLKEFFNVNLDLNIKTLIMFRQNIIKEILNNNSKTSEWCYCLEPTENDNSDRLKNNKYILL